MVVLLEVKGIGLILLSHIQTTLSVRKYYYLKPLVEVNQSSN